jgi:predicted fused transcriptional regulator/phosphomethylpyrimidine kinase
MNKEYTTPGERGVATRLVRAAIHAGYAVSVYDGEEYTVKRSRRERQILAALASTEEDWLVIRDSAGERVGALVLIWGNDPDGEELIADYTDKPEIEALANAAQR